MVETHVVLGTGPLEVSPLRALNEPGKDGRDTESSPLEGLEMGRDRAPLGGETTDRILEWGRDRDQ